MKRFYSLCLLCTLSMQMMFAQHTLSGKVINEASEPIPYSTVRVLGTDSTLVGGMTADSLGVYRIDNVKAGKYLLAVNVMGNRPSFKPFTMPDKDLEMTPVVLNENVSLGEVVVNGSMFIRHKDKLVAVPDKEQVKHAYTGYDLLYNLMIPALDVDRHNGTVTTPLGDVSLYINGIKAEYREVKALRPKDIEKVEYIDMPTGKYAGEKVVVNYITKQRETGGYVSIDGWQTIGYEKDEYNIAAKVSHKKTDYTFFGGHRTRDYKDKEEQIDDFHLTTLDIHREAETSNMRTRDHKQYAQMNIDHRGKKNTLSAKFGLTRLDSPENDSYDKRVTYNSDDPFISKNISSALSLSPTVRLQGNFQLTPKQHLNLNLSGGYTDNKYDRIYTEGLYNYETHAKENLYSMSLGGNYSVQLAHQNSIGLSFGHYHSISSSDYTGDYVGNNHFWRASTSLAPTYNQRIGNKLMLMLQAGAMMSYRKLHGSDFHKFISPSAYVQTRYQLNPKQSLMLMLGTSSGEPGLSAVTSVDQDIDAIQVRRGNPDLKTLKSYYGYLGYDVNIGKVSINAYSNLFAQAPAFSNDYYVEGDRLINSYQTNSENYQIFNDVYASYKANKNLRMRLGGGYMFSKATGHHAASQNSWYCSTDINYYLKDFSFNLYARSMRRMVLSDGAFFRTPLKYGASVAWSHKNWNLETGAREFFSRRNRQLSYFDSDIYVYEHGYMNAQEQMRAYVRAAYTFGFGKKVAKARKDVNSNMDSGILRETR